MTSWLSRYNDGVFYYRGTHQTRLVMRGRADRRHLAGWLTLLALDASYQKLNPNPAHHPRRTRPARSGRC
jgi:hypothetical protein